MILLKTDPILSDLKSTTLKIDKLLEKAKEDSVTGFIQFDFPSFSAAILLVNGEILQCIKIKHEKPYPVSKTEIFRDLEEMEAYVGFYRLKRDMLLITYRMADSVPLFENMRSRNVDVKQLLLTLEADNLSGVVVLKSQNGECYLVLEEGSPSYCICRRDNETIDNAECLGQFLDAPEKDVLISIYREKGIDILARLKQVVIDVMGESVEKIDRMLEESGRSREELLKTVKEIEKYTYLFFDKKRAKILSEKLEKTIEEVM